MNACTQSKGPGGRPVQYPGLLKDARTLGVNPTHLRRVLIGERKSESLLARYRALKGARATLADAIAVSRSAHQKRKSKI